VRPGEQGSGWGNSRWLRALRAWGGQHPDRPKRMTRGEPVILRLIAPLALLVIAAIVVCGALGMVLARQADDYLEAEHRQALRGAIEALQAVSPDLAHVKPKLIHILERASGLKGLRFDSDPPEESREVQSLIGPGGRIVGWFSWEPERPATELMLQLLPFAALIAIGLGAFAALSMWQLSRLGFLLAKREQQVHRLEYLDPLTGLPNRQHMLEILDQTLAARKADESVALIGLDLDAFSDVKDAIGGSTAEKVLLEVADRLRTAMPPHATLVRMRNERFALVLPDTDAQAAMAIAETALNAVSSPIWVDQVVQLSASVGLAVAPRDAWTREELMWRAKLALRTARRRGRGLVIPYAAEMETDFDERQFIRRELPRALAARAFDVHYQPIVQANGGAVVGVEALLRWNHPSRGFIPPALFVRVAEEAGLMDQLGEFVLRRALNDAARWPELYVAVNLSPMQVRDRKFVDLVAAVLAETKTEPSRLVLEITEGVLIDDPDTAKSRLQDLRALGARLALDDFGSGYSSLTYLQHLPFDKLKIDRAFVVALNQSANAGVIIQAIVTLGRALGMSVLIEGVETEEQRVLLRLAGCNEMQGFLFAKPAPREAIDRMMAAKAVAAAGAAPALSTASLATG
jgi:diguanylate cyclase (GGDEF)-like protein